MFTPNTSKDLSKPGDVFFFLFFLLLCKNVRYTSSNTIENSGQKNPSKQLIEEANIFTEYEEESIRRIAFFKEM